ncbi:transposase family Tnp2 protein [Rhizoctonia solani 123E]|uniref:Transposase family Tnp2 protein n=1 Tax=Rhizoctonia solani 123E TaxID=1423351 RepID=A0A074RNB2_9AGAM|nr:transposase family Tnp2 protein [Rhizoctonia solani 123E]
MMNSLGCVDAAREKARKARKRLDYYLPGSKKLCDCVDCYGNNVPLRPGTIDKHRRERGVHPDAPSQPQRTHPSPLQVARSSSGPSGSSRIDHIGPSRTLDSVSSTGEAMKESPTFDMDCEPDHTAILNTPEPSISRHTSPTPYFPSGLSELPAGSRRHSWSRAQSQSHSHSQSQSRPQSQSQSRSRSQSRSQSPHNRSASHSPAINHPQSSILCGSSDSDEENEAPPLGQGDPVADAVIFGSLLHKPRKVMTPPPLRLRGGDDGDRGPGEGGVDEDWGGMDWAGNRNYGGDGPDNPDDQDPEEGVEAEHPEIQVPPDEPREAPEDPGDEGAGAEIPALNEYPVLRNIYLRVWVQYAFAGATQSSIESMLKSHKFSLLASSIFGGFPPELIVQIQNMPTTLRSLERRLGLDFSDLLIIYALCPDPNCGKRYTMEELNELPSPRCTRHVAGLQCHGIMYEERTLADNTRKRIPMKTLPYNPVPAALGRLFSRVGMLDLAQIGKQDEADAPADPQTWFDQVGPDDPFGSMKKTWWWPTQLVGLQRELVNGEYVDVPTGNAPLFLTRLPVGFSLGVNMDGFGATRGKFSRHGGYSVNGCYIVVNDLPFYQRTLIENMILALVIPGPNEPKGYALEQMLEPLVTDLIALVNGVELPIYNSATGQIEQRLVYAKLSGVFVDWIARIKCTGHVGVTAEENHCLYCKIQQCLLSDERGYQSENYELRDPHEHLQLKYEWLEAADEDREEIRQRNGTIFTEFDRIPGFYSFDDCPIDAMHLFDLGMTRAIIRDIIYKPGMLRKRFRDERDRDIPEARFNAFFARTWFPWHCSRLPASIEKMTGCAKAEQWRSMVVVLPAALFEAWRVADTIPNANIQRGGANTVHSKTQTANAKLLLRRRVKLHELDGGGLQDMPTVDDCASSRNPRDYFGNVLRYCVAYSGISRHKLTRTLIDESAELLEQVGIIFTEMNIHLPPTFHAATHMRDHLLKYGNVFGTWAYPFERANRLLAMGFLRRAESYRYVKVMQSIEEPTADDIETTKVLLGAMRDGPEHEIQRGMLGAVLAGEARFHQQQRLRLATISAKVDFNKHEHRQFYRLLVDYCNQHNPFENTVFYGHGIPQPNGHYLHPKSSTVCYSHFFRYGVRYGSANNHRGRKSQYGYIENRIPVIIQGIYETTVEIQGQEHKFLAVMVQRFVAPAAEPLFPWAHWNNRLEIDAWEFQRFAPLEAVSATTFNGVFALSDINMTCQHYWLTFAMIRTRPEDLDEDD